MGKTAILLHNLGGPAGKADVQPFLERLFSDPEIIRLPLSRLVQRPFARFLSRRRAPEAWKNYEAIGGGSPVLLWTRLQGEGLALALREHCPDEEVRILPAMRYTPPFVDDAVRAAQEWGADRLLSFTLYPHYSTTTTGSSERELERCLVAHDYRPEVVKISDWGEDPGYLDCLAWRVRRAVDAVPAALRSRTHLVYSAHGIPLRFVQEGDPYVDRIQATVRGVEARLGGRVPHILAFQSRVGPVRWTEPHLDEVLRELGRGSTGAVVVVAVSFVSDHVETLYELDIQMRQIALEAGIEHYARAAALNADPDFLGVLGALAAGALQRSP